MGVAAVAAVTRAAPLESATLFGRGTAAIGLGGGLFGVGVLTAAMDLGGKDRAGLALGAWGAVQATAMGGGIALGGFIRDGVAALAAQGALGPALTGPAIGYGVVYNLEILLLFAALIAIGPLVGGRARAGTENRFGLAEFPG